MYISALAQFQYQAGRAGEHGTTNPTDGAFVNYVLTSGLLTDELQAADLGGPPLAYTAVSSSDSLDARIFPEGNFIYGQLHAVRKDGNQALGALATYDPTAPPALRGQLFAYEGYAEILLADLFCSGVPLSTLDFNQDFTYRPSSTTTEVYQHAITLLDSAIALSTDSTRIESLALIGKARALVDLGQYAAAAALVTQIPTTFAYQFMVDWTGGTTVGGTSVFGQVGGPNQGASVADREGLNGMPYISGGDPRTTVEQYNTNKYQVAQYAPTKYGLTQLSVTPITVASGIEARLIEAEAALQSGSATWLTILNDLRTSGQGDSVAWVDTVDVSPPVYGDSGRLVSTQVDTVYNDAHTSITHIYTINIYRRVLWQAGTGGVQGLYPITDPGNDAARLDTLFAERAAWLFLTGQRQGDLRRLVRNYSRDPETVYPTGAYPLGGALPQYGTGVNLQIPRDEFVNPLYRGCLSRGA
jgi:hypothetical protein